MRFSILTCLGLLVVTGCTDGTPRTISGQSRTTAGATTSSSVVELTDADLPAGVTEAVVVEVHKPPQNVKTEAPAVTFQLETGFRYRNLTIYPVVPTADQRAAKAETDFITLAEGLRAGTVVAQEQGNGRGAEVSTILFDNLSDKPLYLMSGQTLIGGKQDRTIAGASIVPPGARAVRVAVYCVEHGRWNARGEAGTASLLEALAEWTQGMSADELRALVSAAENGRFVATTGVLNRSVRKVVARSRGQQSVWNEVERVNVKTGTKTETAAFTANFADPELIRLVQTYESAFLQRISEQQGVLGVVVAVNGKPVASDIFGNSKLFLKLWPTLLKGYALDAIVEYDPSGPNPLCSQDRLDEFVAKIRASQSGSVTTNGQLSVTTHAAIGKFEAQSADYNGESIHKANFE